MLIARPSPHHLRSQSYQVPLSFTKSDVAVGQVSLHKGYATAGWRVGRIPDLALSLCGIETGKKSGECSDGRQQGRVFLGRRDAALMRDRTSLDPESGIRQRNGRSGTWSRDLISINSTGRDFYRRKQVVEAWTEKHCDPRHWRSPSRHPGPNACAFSFMPTSGRSSCSPGDSNGHGTERQRVRQQVKNLQHKQSPMGRAAAK